MRLFAYIGSTLSLLVLGAHFYRDGLWLLTVGCVALIGLLAFGRTWAVRVLQVALVLGALEWLWTAFLLVQERMALGRPWTRLVLILGIVAVVAAASAAALEKLRRRA